MLFFTNDQYTNGYTYYSIYLLIILAIISAIYVIISNNPIYSVLYLIALFATIAIYLIMIDLNFIGISYLLVYVGAVTILFLFILMLINIRRSEIADHYKNSFPLGLLITIFFLFTVKDIISINIIDLNIEFSNVLYVFSNA
jgi:NADH-ubiquinone oxidoreductase chain 6